MAQFGLTVLFRLHPGMSTTFLPLMLANAAASQAEEPGCLRFDVLIPEAGDKSDVFLYEVYVDSAAFEAHLSTPHYSTFDAATRHMVAAKEVQRYILETLP